ncbi:hypothetical protein [Paracoccus alcaliphilus]|uniref:hypothetical protein n=1 Tax=Paracoccus alcaliphilus TaxID=34002 RepID=UPI001113F9EB|nr:hypothetical protein [Paracoccus alcaliphilus]
MIAGEFIKPAAATRHSKLTPTGRLKSPPDPSDREFGSPPRKDLRATFIGKCWKGRDNYASVIDPIRRRDVANLSDR